MDWKGEGIGDADDGLLIYNHFSVPEDGLCF